MSLVSTIVFSNHVTPSMMREYVINVYGDFQDNLCCECERFAEKVRIYEGFVYCFDCLTLCVDCNSIENITWVPKSDVCEFCENACCITDTCTCRECGSLFCIQCVQSCGDCFRKLCPDCRYDINISYYDHDYITSYCESCIMSYEHCQDCGLSFDDTTINGWMSNYLGHNDRIPCRICNTNVCIECSEIHSHDKNSNYSHLDSILEITKKYEELLDKY